MLSVAVSVTLSLLPNSKNAICFRRSSQFLIKIPVSVAKTMTLQSVNCCIVMPIIFVAFTWARGSLRLYPLMNLIFSM